MGIFSNFLSKLSRGNIHVTRDRSGNWSYFMEGSTFGNEQEFLEWSLNNPVLFIVLSVQADLFSQMKVTAVNTKGEEIEAPELKLIEQPNYFQSRNEFLYQYLWFLKSAGTNFIYKIQPLSTQPPQAIFNLIPSEIDYNRTNEISKFIVSKTEVKDFENKKIKYKLNNTTYDIPYTDLLPTYDIANGLINNSFTNSPSRVQAVSKTLQNIDENLKAKNINLKFAQKFLASKKSNNEFNSPIDPKEKQSIENILMAKAIQITSEDLNITHLVSDMKRLYLDEIKASDANEVALAFGMNNDIVNFFLGKSSTFENQEQGAIRFIQNSIQSTADNLMSSISSFLGTYAKGYELKASFSHLPVMQAVLQKKMQSFEMSQKAIKLGLDNKTITETQAIEMTEKFIKSIGL